MGGQNGDKHNESNQCEESDKWDCIRHPGWYSNERRYRAGRRTTNHVRNHKSGCTGIRAEEERPRRGIRQIDGSHACQRRRWGNQDKRKKQSERTGDRHSEGNRHGKCHGGRRAVEAHVDNHTASYRRAPTYPRGSSDSVLQGHRSNASESITLFQKEAERTATKQTKEWIAHVLKR